MKKCTTCQQFKSLDQFQVRKASADGRSASCKECLRARDAARYEKERPKRLLAMQRYQKTERGKASHAASVEKWQRLNADRRAAHVIFNNALRDGRVTPWPVCALPECEGTDVEAHHADYSRPLDVVWLCKAHHEQLHAEHQRNLRRESNGNP